MKTARQILSSSPAPPYRSSVRIANAILRETLGELGYEISCLWRPLETRKNIVNWLPLRSASNVLEIQSHPVDLELRDNTSAHLFHASHARARRNVILFHALIGAGESWIGNDAIDGYWGNSDYTARVLSSFLSLPNWKTGSLLEPRAFSIVGRVTLPLPYLELSGVFLEAGAAELPANVRTALDSDDILGHCVTDKLDPKATYAIMLALNQIALQSGIGRRFRLLIGSALYEDLQRRLEDDAIDVPREFLPFKAHLGRLGLTIADLLIPVPFLAQAPLFEVLRACRFGLQYHWLPEPFGFFPLESVCHGCPVYSNGAGNLRYLVPAGCGIHVQESEAMVFGDPTAYFSVAQRIFEDTVVNPQPVREACRRGAEYIATTYTRQALRRDLLARLAELEESASEHDLDSATIGLSPMVRAWYPTTRRIVSDVQSAELPLEHATLLGEILGQRCGDLECRGSSTAMEIVEGLFQQGFLTLLPVDGKSADPASTHEADPGAAPTNETSAMD